MLDRTAFLHYLRFTMEMNMNQPLPRITSYLEQLHAMSTMAGVDLLWSFLKADLPSSTYYRAINGTELRFETATKVASVLRNQIKLKANGSSHVASGTETAPQGKHALC